MTERIEVASKEYTQAEFERNKTDRIVGLCHALAACAGDQEIPGIYGAPSTSTKSQLTRLLNDATQSSYLDQQ